MLSYFSALILSIIEGLTEFIPVSSTGHMIIVSSLMGLSDEAVKTFEIWIQLGAILSVVALYPQRFLALIPKFAAKDNHGDLAGTAGIIRFALACAPVFVLGFLFHKMIKAYLFGPITVAAALICGGVLMIVIEKQNIKPKISNLNHIPLRTCFLIGLAQCLALWPGMSRSGATIIGGMLLGLERRVAAEFSFLVAVPVMCVAVGYDLLKSMHTIVVNDMPIFAFGFILAFIVSLFAIKYFVALLGRITLRGFGWYRIMVGILVLGYFGL
jgi:undecaprenyl-diphosphatase